MSHVDQGPLPSYNSLVDNHLNGYFTNTRMRRHLRKAGLITKRGEIVSENTYRLNMSRKEHKKHVKDMLAQAIVHKTLDLERTRQAEIKKKIEEIAKIELVRRVRAERNHHLDDSLLPYISPRASQPKGKSKKKSTAPPQKDTSQGSPKKERHRNTSTIHERASRQNRREQDILPYISPRSGSRSESRPSSGSFAGKGQSRYKCRPISAPSRKGRRPISALSSNYEDDEEVVVYIDDEGRPITPAHVDETELRYSSKDPIDTKHLYSLDTAALRKYAMLMARMEQGQGGLASPYLIPQVPLPPKSPRDGRTPRSGHRYRNGHVSKSCSPKRPTTANQAYLHPAGSAKRYRGQQETLCEVHMRYHGSSLSLAREQFDRRQDIMVEQQHCGGNTLTVFRDKLEPDTKFSFVSYRHRGYPFSLTIYIDGQMDCRISTCCEYRHQKGGRIGGKNGHFGIIKITGTIPCYKCQVEKGVKIRNQAPRPKLKRPPEQHEEVTIVDTARKETPSPQPVEEKSENQNARKEIEVSVEDVEDQTAYDKYDDDFETSSSSASESEQEEGRSGLDAFQPKDARAVEKTTGRVDINDHSDSGSNDTYKVSHGSRRKKTKGRGSQSRSSSESSAFSSSSEDSTKRGNVQRQFKETPDVKDSRGQAKVKSSPPDAARGISPRPYVYNRHDNEVRGEQQEVQEPVKTSAVDNGNPPPKGNDNARPKSSIQRESVREEKKANVVEKNSPQMEIVKEERSLGTMSAPVGKTRKRSTSSSSSSAPSSENSDSENEDVKDGKDNDVVNVQTKVECDDEEEAKGREEDKVMPFGEAVDAEDEADQSRLASYQGPVSVQVEAQEEKKENKEVELAEKEETLQGPKEPVVVEEEVKEPVVAVPELNEPDSTIERKRHGSDASLSSSSLSSSSSSAGSAAISDKGPNIQNDPTVVYGETTQEENKNTEDEKETQVVTTAAPVIDPRKASATEDREDSGSSSDSDSNNDDDSSSSSDSDTENKRKDPPVSVKKDSVIETTAEVHNSDDGGNEKTGNRHDPDSDPEATHGGNDPDNVANDLGGSMLKPMQPIVAPLPREGSILPLLEKSVNTVEVNAVTLNKTQVYEAAQFLEKKDRINQLNFVNCGIDDDDVQKLVEALKASPSKPVLLNLSLNSLTVGCVDHILDLLDNKPSIEAILLQGTRLGDEGVEKLVDGILRQHEEKIADGDQNVKELKELDLSDSKFGDQGAQALARLIMSGMEIDTITLSSNHAVSCEGWKIIGDALSKNQEIETLTLDHNFIGDEGVDYIAKGLYNNTSVTALDLNDVGLTEKGGKCLMELLKRNTTILEITHVGNKISEQQKEEIKKYISLNKTVRPPL